MEAVMNICPESFGRKLTTRVCVSACCKAACKLPVRAARQHHVGLLGGAECTSSRHAASLLA